MFKGRGAEICSKISQSPISSSENPEAQFIVPDWGDKVDYGTALSYRPVGAGTTYAIVDFIPQSVRDYEFGYWYQKNI
jgi:hypothetical protein